MNKLIYRFSRMLTWVGGATLTIIALMSVASIAGRALSFTGLGPVPGDFEMVEVGTALAVFCFLPWAHLRNGHAAVDLFWSHYPPAMQRVLSTLSDALMLVVWVLLVWRMAVCTEDYRANGEVTFILQFPVWWGYAASLLPAAFGCLIYAWRLLEDLGLAQPGDDLGTVGGGH
jgi:TRAP-type C4-dicarboxylate transport system permease small subunit